MDAFALERGVAAAFRIVDAANEFIASSEPWAIARDPARADELSQVLFDVAEAVRVAAVLLLPVMPKVGRRDSAPRRRDAAGRRYPPCRRRMEQRGHAPDPEGRFPLAARGIRGAERPEKTRRRTRKPESSKRRSVVEETQNTPASTGRPPAAPAPAAPAAPAACGGDKISIDDFMKVDLRVARVLTAEKVPNSRKLVKLSIDVGTEQRTLVAGIAEAYEPEQLVGRTIVIVFNLKPAKLMGIESNGMVLAASPEGGKPTLVGFDQDVPLGSRVR